MMKRNAFTMIELVFVIVILGILSAIAIPRLAATRDDAQMAKARSDVAAVRAAIISERQTRLMRGQSAYISVLGTSSNAFEGNDSGTTPLMMYPPKTGSGKGEWSTSDGLSYTVTVADKSTTFTYTPANGTFNCTASSSNYCDKLAK